MGSSLKGLTLESRREMTRVQLLPISLVISPKSFTGCLGQVPQCYLDGKWELLAG